MTPGARIQAAIEISKELEATRERAESVVNAYFRRRRYAGAKDRRAIADRVYDGLRRRARLEWWVMRVLGDPGSINPRTRLIAELALCDGLTLEEMACLFDGNGYAPEPFAAPEMRLASAVCGQSLDDPAMPEWVALEVPDWLIRPFRDAFGADLQDELTALNKTAPVDLRVNTAKCDRSSARAILAADGIASEPTPLSPVGLRLEGYPRIASARAFREGLVEVQDEASQLVALLTDARPGMTVVDFCAGAGGKTLAFAAAMTERGVVKGQLWACDVSAARLKRMDPRLERAGIPARQIRRHSLTKSVDVMAIGAERADRVLVDAPCTGTGVWRRAPEAKWRLAPDDLEARILEQRDILNHAARLLRPGGVLVYATCSMLEAENEAQIRHFLDAHANFCLLPIPNVWLSMLDAPCPTADRFLRLTPWRTGTDGFLVAVLQRES